MQHRGHVTKTGASLARQLLVEATVPRTSWLSASTVTKFYVRLKKRKGMAKAGVSFVARLLRAGYWMLRVDIDFSGMTLPPTTRIVVRGNVPCGRQQNAAAEGAPPSRLRIEADNTFVPPTGRGRAGPLARTSAAAAADALGGSLPPVERWDCRLPLVAFSPKCTWPGPVFCRGTAVARRADFAGRARRPAPREAGALEVTGARSRFFI